MPQTATISVSNANCKRYTHCSAGHRYRLIVYSPQCFALNVASLRETFFLLPRRTAVESDKDFSHATAQRKSGSEEGNISN